MRSCGPFQAEKRLGNGSAASVYLARHFAFDVRLAIKTISRAYLNTECRQTRFAREASLQRSFKHPFIAELFYVSRDNENEYLCMEYLDHGTLLDLVNTRGRLNEIRARHYFIQLVWVLEYLHGQAGAVHRDFKCENIMIDRHDNVRVIDFGLSAVAGPEEKMFSMCGSPAYAAPEMLDRQGYTATIDVWSLGVVLYVMVVGRFPFQGSDFPALFAEVRSGNIEFPPFLSVGLTDLLKRMLCRDPKERIDTHGIKEHPWFPGEEYAAMVQFATATQERLYGTEGNVVVDTEVIEKLEAMGMECSGLPQDLLAMEETEATILYAVCRRETFTDMMKAVPELGKRCRFVEGQQRRDSPRTLFRPRGNRALVSAAQSATVGLVLSPRLLAPVAFQGTTGALL
jgi:serine/threonine protein kinase